MSNNVFDAQLLAEKLSKLNNSQQSIESLSRWCISHRKKARQIVETWDKLFNSAQRDQRVSFLYLANDILQNSRRQGSDFVNEFWKILPAALKHVYENSDEKGKKAVKRLVNIWEERKVFGSHGQSLKDEMLGKITSSAAIVPVSNGKSLNPIKIVKKDAHSIRIKLAVGGLPEMILMAFQSVFDEYPNEEVALNKCSAAASHVGKVREEIENTKILGNQLGSPLVDELQEQENVLQQCVGQLESAETTRAMLISLLKEALHEQESKLDLICAQSQAARGHIEQASNLRKRLISPIVTGHSTSMTIPMTETIRAVDYNAHPVQPSCTPPQPPLTQPVVSFASMKAIDEESKKAAAAAIAAKLAASTSSAQMLTSVLSSLVAEEAASMNGSVKSTGSSSNLSMFSPEKRPKLDKTMPMSEVSNSDGIGTSYFNSLQQQPVSSLPLMPPSTGMQVMSQSNQMQASFGALPPLPPPPSAAPGNQFVQSAGMVAGVMPYGYGGNTLPPPPPLPPHMARGLARPASQPRQQSQSQQPQQQQQQQQQQPQPPVQAPATGGYYRPPGIGFYGQNTPTATPPVLRP